MARVYLSLGSNVGDRVEHLRAAIRLLETTPGIRFVDASMVYETEPWEQAPGQIPSRASWFFNSVVAIETTLDLADLLARPHEIERGLGRVRSTAPRWRRQAEAPSSSEATRRGRKGRRGLLPDDLDVDLTRPGAVELGEDDALEPP